MILRPSTPKPRRAAWNLHFAIEGARSLNRLPSNLPRSLRDTIFHSAGAAWTVYFCSQGVNLRPAPQPFWNSFIGRTALPGVCFADYFSHSASVKFTLTLTKRRGEHEIQRRRNGTTEELRGLSQSSLSGRGRSSNHRLRPPTAALRFLFQQNRRAAS